MGPYPAPRTLRPASAKAEAVSRPCFPEDKHLVWQRRRTEEHGKGAREPAARRGGRRSTHGGDGQRGRTRRSLRELRIARGGRGKTRILVFGRGTDR